MEKNPDMPDTKQKRIENKENNDSNKKKRNFCEKNSDFDVSSSSGSLQIEGTVSVPNGKKKKTDCIPVTTRRNRKKLQKQRHHQ